MSLSALQIYYTLLPEYCRRVGRMTQHGQADGGGGGGCGSQDDV